FTRLLPSLASEYPTATIVTSTARPRRPNAALDICDISSSDRPLFAPAPYENPITATNAIRLTVTTVQTVELNRPFIEPPKNLSKTQTTGTGKVSANRFKLNARAKRS